MKIELKYQTKDIWYNLTQYHILYKVRKNKKVYGYMYP